MYPLRASRLYETIVETRGKSGCSTALTNDSNEDSQVASPKWHWKSHKQIQSRHDVYNFNSHIMIAEFHANRFQTNKLVYSKPGSWVQPVWKTWVKHKHGKTVIPEPGSLLLTYKDAKWVFWLYDPNQVTGIAGKCSRMGLNENTSSHNKGQLSSH